MKRKNATRDLKRVCRMSGMADLHLKALKALWHYEKLMESRQKYGTIQMREKRQKEKCWTEASVSPTAGLNRCNKICKVKTETKRWKISGCLPGTDNNVFKGKRKEKKEKWAKIKRCIESATKL